MARPRRAIEEARAFGALVEAECQRLRKLNKRGMVNVEVAMAAVAGYDRNRWGKRTKWFSLWRAYKTDKKRRAEDDAKLAQLRDHPIMREHTRQLAATNRVLAPELRAIAEIKRVLARR